MSIPQYLEHLLSFLAPALVVALLVALAGPLVLPRNPARPSWWLMAAMNFLAGAAVLGAGLWLFGRDGKMATYLGLVLAVATCEWLAGRGWRS